MVIFEGGYQANSAVWSKVQPAIAAVTRACAYDRAGYGFSDPGPPPRNGRAIANDLDQALWAAHIHGPYVLVGHSAGALYARLFAELRLREVVGMVLVDPSVEHQDKAFAAAFGPGAGGVDALLAKANQCLAASTAGKLPSTDPGIASCTPASRRGSAADPDPATKAPFWRTSISELETLWTDTSDELDFSHRSYGAVPLVVLTADGTYASVPARYREKADAVWRDLHGRLAMLSSSGQERLVAGSSHMIMIDRPQSVIDAIEQVVRTARSKPQHLPTPR